MTSSNIRFREKRYPLLHTSRGRNRRLLNKIWLFVLVSSLPVFLWWFLNSSLSKNATHEGIDVLSRNEPNRVTVHGCNIHEIPISVLQLSMESCNLTSLSR
mmetsp:Transcript_5542/g.6440  ORF Transcript_5542/g.6440 Transcript_5542/m.6440 type:complete len:101 (+) Transcript_5542:144-446(+)